VTKPDLADVLRRKQEVPGTLPKPPITVRTVSPLRYLCTPFTYYSLHNY